jgi:plasmid maintenance system antidote protein VapI
LRLAKYFGTSARLWLNLQSDYELRRVKSGDWAEAEKRIRPLDAA